MRKLYFSIFLVLIGYLLTDSLTQATVLRSSGSPGGASGSPGVGNQTCTSCHGGTAATRTGIITTDIPTDGYVPGTMYTITVTISDPARTTYGFEVRAEVNLKSVGTMTNISTAETKILSPGTNNESATHKSTSISAPSGTKTWMFNWTAPIAGTGPVIFYGAFNAANGNGGTSGDNIYKSQITVEEFVAPCSIKDAVVAVDETEICEGDDVSFIMPGSESGVIYYLRDNTTLDTIDTKTGNGDDIFFKDTNVTASRMYQFYAFKTDDCNLILSDKISLTVHNYPLLAVFMDSSDFCEGETVDFVAESTGSEIEWTGPSGFTSSELEPSITNLKVDQSGWYVVSAYNSTLCQVSDSVFIFVNALDSISLSDVRIEACEADTVQLSVFSSSDSAIWQGINSTFNGTQIETVVEPVDSGLYTVTSTGICTVTDTFHLVVTQLPDLALDFSTESVCNGEPVTLSAITNADSLVWQTPVGTIPDSTIIQLDSASSLDSGLYTVSAFNNQCEVVLSKQLSVSEKLSPIIDKTGKVIKCKEDTLLLSTGKYAGYIWSTGDTTQSIQVFGNTNDTISVQVSSNAGCTGESIENTIVFTPIVNQPIIEYDTVCMGDTTLLLVSEEYAAYEWHTSDTTANVAQFEANEAYVTVVDSNGCLAYSDTMKVEFYSLPIVTINEIGNDSLNVEYSNGRYQWYRNDSLVTGVTEAGLKVAFTGSYVAEVTDTLTGCVGYSDSVFVTITNVENLAKHEGYRFFPNPVRGVLTVKFHSSTNGTAELRTMQGKVVARKMTNSDLILIDTQTLSKGVYLLKIISNNDAYWENVIVQ